MASVSGMVRAGWHDGYFALKFLFPHSRCGLRGWFQETCERLLDTSFIANELSDRLRSLTWRKDRILPTGLRPNCVQYFGEHMCERWDRIWHCFLAVYYYKPLSKADLMWKDGVEKGLGRPIW